MTDVNNGAQAAPAASSATTQSQSATSQTQQPTQSSSETLTHGGAKAPEHVPYERFREVNESANQYKEKLSKYEQNQELYRTYEQLDQMLAQDPQLADQVKEILRKKTAQQAPAQQQPQQNQPSANQPTDYQRVTYDRYVDEFHALMDKEGVAKELQGRIFQMALNEAGQVNPNCLNIYDRNLTKAVFENLKPLLGSTKAQDRAEYVESKKKDNNVPSSTTGPAPGQQTSFGSRSERMNYIASSLKAGT